MVAVTSEASVPGALGWMAERFAIPTRYCLVTDRLLTEQVLLMLSGPRARRSWPGNRQPHYRSEFDALPITTSGTASDTAGQVCCSLHRPPDVPGCRDVPEHPGKVASSCRHRPGDARGRGRPEEPAATDARGRVPSIDDLPSSVIQLGIPR